MAFTVSAGFDEAELGHWALSSGRLPGRFPCPQCGKVYRWKWNLTSHLKEDCGRVPQFQCQLCPYTSKRARNLALHGRRVHKKPRSAGGVAGATGAAAKLGLEYLFVTSEPSA